MINTIKDLYPKNLIKIPNHIGTSAAQYMLRKGTKQYNLCGEFCVSFCMQDEAHTNNIDDFLDYWEANDLKWYKRWFYNGISRTTGITDLERMLSDYKVKTPCQSFSPIISLNTVENKLIDFQAIIGVQINYAGYLVGRGIPHWVVLDSLPIVIDNNHAIANIYNPFTNNIEPYSWIEVMTSTGAYKQGIWIRRISEKE